MNRTGLALSLVGVGTGTALLSLLHLVARAIVDELTESAATGHRPDAAVPAAVLHLPRSRGQTTSTPRRPAVRANRATVRASEVGRSTRTPR